LPVTVAPTTFALLSRLTMVTAARPCRLLPAVTQTRLPGAEEVPTYETFMNSPPPTHRCSPPDR
jgi:hypothetical protein